MNTPEIGYRREPCTSNEQLTAALRIAATLAEEYMSERPGSVPDLAWEQDEHYAMLLQKIKMPGHKEYFELTELNTLTGEQEWYCLRQANDSQELLLQKSYGGFYYDIADWSNDTLQKTVVEHVYTSLNDIYQIQRGESAVADETQFYELATQSALDAYQSTIERQNLISNPERQAIAAQAIASSITQPKEGESLSSPSHWLLDTRYVEQRARGRLGL